ncbi:MAG: hypothetical protein HDR41_00270 [Lactobacillus sp.]|nr:hypothetical protein [Lactobacillus sp.]
MKKLKVGYFKNFGSNELNLTKEKFEQNFTDCTVELRAYSQAGLKDALENHKVDIVYTDIRDEAFSDKKIEPIVNISLMALLQAGNFMAGQQTIELDQLENIPLLLVSEEDDEVDEYHYYKDLLHINSPFLAVNSFDEAALMAQSGSGYFILNELAANLIYNDQLQKLFLLRNGKQLRQECVCVYNQEGNKYINEFVKLLKENVK